MRLLIVRALSAMFGLGLASPALAQSGFNDGSFDSQGYSVGGYCYFFQGTCPAGAWSGVDAAGIIETSNGAWGGIPANSPRHYAFVQITGQLRQTFTATQSGSFRFSWYEADRPNGQGGQTYLVKVNNTTVATFTSSSASFISRDSNPFSLVAGQSYTVSFEGTSSNVDRTAFIDSVTLVALSSGSEQANYTYDVLGRLTNVTLVGGNRSGLSANYSLDAAGNRSNVTVSGAPN